MRSQPKKCPQLSFPVRSFLQTRPEKKWQGSSSATTVACARQVLDDRSLALNVMTDHCPELTKKQMHTKSGFGSCPLFLFFLLLFPSSVLFSSLLFSSLLFSSLLFSSLLFSSLLFSSLLSVAVLLWCVFGVRSAPCDTLERPVCT